MRVPTIAVLLGLFVALASATPIPPREARGELTLAEALRQREVQLLFPYSLKY